MFAKRLKEARKARGVTQKQLATMIGVSEGAVKTWEQETADPSVNALRSIAIALGVSADYLLGYDVPMDLVVETSKDVKRLIEVVEKLPDAHREALLKYAELLNRGNDDV